MEPVYVLKTEAIGHTGAPFRSVSVHKQVFMLAAHRAASDCLVTAAEHAMRVITGSLIQRCHGWIITMKSGGL